MPDRLYEDIKRAIGQEVDGGLFERCAVDLLREAHYPDLRGTPHGRDAGHGRYLRAGQRSGVHSRSYHP